MITCTFEDGGTAALRHVVVHAIVEMNGALLLEKRAGDILETGKWGLPSGFLNRGENIEQATLRELKEETGWEGEIVSLFRINSSPNRPKEDRQNVAFEFIVKPIKEVSSPDQESSKVEWVPIEKLWSLEKLAFDHGDTIKLYLDYTKKSFQIPLLL